MTELERLLAIEDIKRLKARYFRCVDTKDWAGLRSTFADDLVFDITSDMPEAGIIGGAEAAVAVPRQALGPDVVSVHHGHCAEIDILGTDSARAIWAMEDWLRWNGPDLAGQELHGFGHYHETYAKGPQGWQIASLRLSRLRVDFTPPRVVPTS